MGFDDLEHFLKWWLAVRPINSPAEDSTNFNGELNGVVLYRQPPYQVQLFIVKPSSTIEAHVHPNVDSFEVFIAGDIKFTCNGVEYDQSVVNSFIRVKPDSWHGGIFGERGGCFLSVQKWLNGTPSTSIVEDWHDKSNNTVGTAAKLEETK